MLKFKINHSLMATVALLFSVINSSCGSGLESSTRAHDAQAATPQEMAEANYEDLEELKINDPNQLGSEGELQPPPLTQAQIQLEQEEAKPFIEPVVATPSQPAKAPVVNPYAHLDPSHVIAPNLLTQAVAFFDANRTRFKNQTVLTIVDFSLPSSAKRLFVVNLRTGKVWATYSAHGKGSDKNKDGIAETFSNNWGSRSSSLGAYLATKAYTGLRGYSLRLRGLSKTNSNALIRGVVIHGGSYVKNAPVTQGRSWGCIVVPPEQKRMVVDTLKDGSLVFAGLGRR